MNISDWIEFDITEADVRAAENLAIETREQARKQQLQTIFQTNALENEIVGLLGEAKFEDYLKEIKINYKKDRPIGQSDKFDFLINGKIVDIKTNNKKYGHPSRSSPDTYKFLVNKSQADKHEEIDYYVSAMVYKNKVWLCGLISRAEVLTYSTDNPGSALCYNIPYTDLHTLQALRKFLSYNSRGG